MSVGARRRVPRYARFANLSVFTPLRDSRLTDGSVLKDDEGINVIYPFNPESSLFVLPLTKDGLDVSGLEPDYQSLVDGLKGYTYSAEKLEM